jgi:hypothetical protein
MKKITFIGFFLSVSTSVFADSILTDERERYQNQQEYQLQQMIDQKQRELGKQQMQELNPLNSSSQSHPYIESPSIKTYQELQQLKQLQR